MRRALGGDEFEAFAQRLVRRQAGDQDLGDLAARDDPVTGIAGMTAIALEEHKPMLVWLVVVEPAGSHDRVRQSAGAHQPLAASLPVVRLGPAVVVALTVGHADGGHQGDAYRSAAQRGEHVADAAVVDALAPALPPPSEPWVNTIASTPSTAAVSVSGRVRSPTTTSASGGQSARLFVDRGRGLERRGPS